MKDVTQLITAADGRYETVGSMMVFFVAFTSPAGGAVRLRVGVPRLVKL